MQLDEERTRANGISWRSAETWKLFQKDSGAVHPDIDHVFAVFKIKVVTYFEDDKWVVDRKRLMASLPKIKISFGCRNVRQKLQSLDLDPSAVVSSTEHSPTITN